MVSTVRKPPSYRLHRPTGQAVVTLNGRDLYLGRHGTPESREAYNRKIAEWLSNDRQLMPKAAPGKCITVTEVIAAFWLHADQHYRKPDGAATSESTIYKHLLRLLDKLYGSTPATSFGPLALKAVRQSMIDKGWKRKSINKQVNRIRRVFTWASAQEVIPATVSHALHTLEGLRQGRGGAKESKPVKPVEPAHVDAIKPFVSRQVWALIELQRMTGAREGELIRLRPVDFDTTSDTQGDTANRIWFVRPDDHKTAHHGHQRIIRFGPRAQEVIRPFLAGRPFDAPLFSPQEAEAERRDQLREDRRSPVQPSQVARAERSKRRRPKRPPGECYTTAAYRRAIERACDDAFPPPEPLAKRDEESREEWKARLTQAQRNELQKWRRDHRWNPHRLRHNAATDIRRLHDLEMAKIILGHKSVAVTEIYAEADEAKATEAMRLIG